MKKKLLALLVAAGMMAVAITGCGNTGDSQDASGNNADSSVVNEDVSGTTEETEYMYSLQVKGTDEATLIITYADGTVEEVGSQSWFGDGSQTFGQMMEEWDIVSIDAKCGDAPFLGWIGYEIITQPDANGFEETFEKPMIMSELYYSTETLMNEILPAGDVVFYTAFEFECGGCEKNKACDVYYIDDGVYYVCADCYEEFATGMGLIEDTN